MAATHPRLPRGRTELGPRPPWLKVRTPVSGRIAELDALVAAEKLHTVCESAACPNRGECWTRGTATFMILGNICTRSCGFCNVLTGRPTELDLDEPRRVAAAVRKMNLKFAVVTSVNRDELADGGAAVWAATIRAIRAASPRCGIEVLIPDFMGNHAAQDTVFAERPDVLNHNVETVPRLYVPVRPQARMERSLELLRRAKAAGLITKSGFMLGLGEEPAEVRQLLRELRAANVDIVTIGQYLQPTPKHLRVARYVHPDEFAAFRTEALALGFARCDSGPLVRSSYHAEEAMHLDSPVG
ncbi:MAG: lipoyl synthase [Planctomycetes bacterium]|nr:lipoyl synthase [Planctomycetota bacterium]MCL4730155.1 lipoyl synthase [Planctomycetota bacterium]